MVGDRPFEVSSARKRALAFKHWADVPESRVPVCKIDWFRCFSSFTHITFFVTAQAVRVFLIYFDDQEISLLLEFLTLGCLEAIRG